MSSEHRATAPENELYPCRGRPGRRTHPGFLWLGRKRDSGYGCPYAELRRPRTRPSERAGTGPAARSANPRRVLVIYHRARRSRWHEADCARLLGIRPNRNAALISTRSRPVSRHGDAAPLHNTASLSLTTGPRLHPLPRWLGRVVLNRFAHAVVERPAPKISRATWNHVR